MTQKLSKIQDRAHSDRSPRNADEEQSPSERGRQAEENVCSAVNHIDDGNRELVGLETKVAADSVPEYPARDQTNAGTSPDHSDPGRTAMEDVFAEKAE